MVVDNPEDIGYFEWTPDGNALLFSTPSDGWNLLKDPISQGKVIQLSDEGNKIDCSFWDIDISPDNNRFAYSTEKQLKIISLNTSKPIRILDAKDLDLIEFGEVKWSPDGENLAFIGTKERTDEPVSTLHERKCQIFSLPMDGGRPIRVATDDDDWKDGLSWSPNGKWIAYSPMKPVKIRPESTIWEADFEEVKAKLLNQN